MKKKHILNFKFDYFSISQYRALYVKDRRYMAIKMLPIRRKTLSILNQSVNRCKDINIV